jgi:hypothetical protein
MAALMENSRPDRFPACHGAGRASVDQHTSDTCLHTNSGNYSLLLALVYSFVARLNTNPTAPAYHGLHRTPDMNLEESILYASAALFVLACYSLSIEGGCEHRVGARTGAWGVPLEVIADAITSRREITSSGWGWPLVGPRGLCDRVFECLCIKTAARASLLSLPEGLHPLETEPQRQDFLNLVQVFARHIDPDIDFQRETERSAINVCNGSSDGSVPARAISSDVQEQEPSAQGAEDASLEPSALDELTLPPEDLEKREEEALRYAPACALPSMPKTTQRISAKLNVPPEVQAGAYGPPR